MINTITRNFISDNFVFTDIRSENLETYNKESLIEKINLWKYILKYQYNAVKQESILIGMQVIDINYFAIIIASAELSLKIVVVDYNRTDKFKNVEYNDPKTKLLSPIDIFLHDFPDNTIETDQVYSKFIFFKTHSRRTYSTVSSLSFALVPELYATIESIMPQPSDVLFRVTSSGTTDVPKVIEHTHEFISAVSLRNSEPYRGIAVHVNNLNHGASASVTLLPLLASKNIYKHLFYDGANPESIDGLVEALIPYKNEIGFLSFPYPFLIDKFIEISREKNVSWPHLDLITLSYILDTGKQAVRDGIFNTITSVFGSNETLGPLFVNISHLENWDIDPRCYSIPNDFYKIRLLDDGKIIVNVPIYNKEVETNDYFDKEGDYFIHRGRSDMFRINGETINMSTVNDLNKQNSSVYIVVDTVYHCLYLACWEDLELDEIYKIKDSIESNFERIKITKIAHLDKSNFYYAIKIDNELLREYFRTYNVS
jgi:acyl-CoA synthetase (AMP-forming)/AMP-acid ligase II